MLVKTNRCLIGLKAPQGTLKKRQQKEFQVPEEEEVCSHFYYVSWKWLHKEDLNNDNINRKAHAGVNFMTNK